MIAHTYTLKMYRIAQRDGGKKRTSFSEHLALHADEGRCVGGAPRAAVGVVGHSRRRSRGPSRRQCGPSLPFALSFHHVIALPFAVIAPAL